MVLLLLLALLTAACGSSSPTAPSTRVPHTDAPSGATSTLSGSLSATNGGQAIAGASVAAQGSSVTTDGAGAFSLTVPAAASLALTISGAGLLTRGMFVNTTGPRALTLDAIRQDGTFDLAFYRQLVRNGFEAPTGLESIRRLPAAPNIYLKTVDETGAPMAPEILAQTEATIRNTAPMWTGGRFGIAGLERGTETRVGVPGWITVRWPIANPLFVCGLADIGNPNGATLDLFYTLSPACTCPSLVTHELGHAFGFFHVNSRNDDVMSTTSFAGCSGQPSARERYHAAIAYARPIGNTDPDNDPIGAVNLRPLRLP